MLSGDRRGASVRRGMTVLGRIPAVPKPINLPSQRLENRGLDPNVEIVPRGGVSWGSAGRSPPTVNNAWAAGTQSSSPPQANGTWASTQKQAPGVSSSGPAWGGTAQSRPSSAGSGTRPSSAGSVGQTQEPQTAANAWGPPLLPSRPLSASATSRVTSSSVVQGQSQGPVHSQPPARPRLDERPRSAEARPAQASRLGEPPSFTSAPAWGGVGADPKTARDFHQPTAFQLTRVDFPTLGSEKSPDLRPQQGTANMERGADDKVFSGHQRQPPNLSGHFEEMPRAAVATFGAPERPGLDTWRRDPPFGPVPGVEGNWHREDHRQMASHDGHPPVVDSWRRESGHDVSPGASPDESWRRGRPLVGPAGSHGPGRFAHDPSGYPPQQRYGPGPGPVPGPYGRGGPSGYGHHVGDVYGNTSLLARQGALSGRPGPPLAPGIYPGQGPVPYDGSYAGPPMEDRGMMMMGMGMNGPAVYVGFQGRQGPPPEVFNRYPHGSIVSGPRLASNSSRGMREHAELAGPEGEHQEMGTYKDGRAGVQDSLGSRRLGGGPFESMRPGSQGGSIGQHHGLRDWGASANEEPMDFSKPVFEEEFTPGPKGFEKFAGAASNVGNDLERENKTNVADRDTYRADDAKPRDRHDEHRDAGRFAGRSGRKPGNQAGNLWHAGESTQESSRVQRPKEDGVKDGGLESEVIIIKQENRKVTVPPEKGSVDGLRKDVSSIQAGKDRSASKDSILVAQKTHPVKHDDGASAASGTGGAMRAGQQVVVQVRSSASGHLSHAVTSVAPESGPVLSPGVEAGVGVVPVLPVDAVAAVPEEKIKVMKRSSSAISNGPNSEPGSIPDIVAPNAGLVSSKEHAGKEEPLHKGKAAHDAEKEWRPKASSAELKVDVSAGTMTQTGEVSVGSAVPPVLTSEAPLPGPEKGEFETDPSTAETYDYEAQVSLGLEGRVVSVSTKRFQECPVKKQRAKMKEIAHQRSLQLQKEEEERNKEQKAKAFAKLEELNRRATGAAAANSLSTRKKRNSRNLKSKHKSDGVDGPTQVVVSSEHSDVGESVGESVKGEPDQDVVSSVELSGESVKELRFQVGGIEFGDLDLHKDVLGIQTVSPRSNGDTTNRRPQAKLQTSKRPRERGVQDVRIGDKAHSNEGLIWAPVRPVVNTVVVASKGLSEDGGSWTGSTDKENARSDLISVSGKDAEVDSLEPSVKPRQNTSLQVAGPSSAPEKNSNQQASERVTGEAHQQGSLPAELRVETDNRPTESRNVRPRASWRQREQGGAQNEQAQTEYVRPQSEQTRSYRGSGLHGGRSPQFATERQSQKASGNSGPRESAMAEKPSHGEQASGHGQQVPRERERLFRERKQQLAKVQSSANRSGGQGPQQNVQGGNEGQNVHFRPVSNSRQQGLPHEKDQPRDASLHQKTLGQAQWQLTSHDKSEQQVDTGKASKQPLQTSNEHQSSHNQSVSQGAGYQKAAQERRRAQNEEAHTEFGRLQSEQTRSYRGSGSHGERRPPFDTDRQPQKLSGNSGPRESGIAEKPLHGEQASGHGEQVSRERERPFRERDQQLAKKHPSAIRSGGQGPQQNVQGGNEGQNVHFRPVSNSRQQGLPHEKDQPRDASLHQKTLGQAQWQQTSHDKSEQQVDTGKASKQPLQTSNEHQSSHNQSVSQGAGYQKAAQERRRAQNEEAHTEFGRLQSEQTRSYRGSGSHGERRPPFDTDRQPQKLSGNSGPRESGIAEKPLHGEQASGHGEQVSRERERPFRERDQQLAKKHPSAIRSGGQGPQQNVQGGNEGQNVQFRPVSNSRQQDLPHEKDQPRDASLHQKTPGQAQWQQTSHDKSEQQVDSGKASKQPLQAANDHQSSHNQSVSQGAGYQKAAQDRRRPQAVSGPLKSHSPDINTHWGDSGSGPFVRGRDHGQSRRGRVGGRGGATGGKASAELETKIEQAGPKRMVIDATGGAVPNLVAG